MLVSAANRTSPPQAEAGQPAVDPSCAVLLLLLAKALLNVAVMLLRRKGAPPRFLECFCVSVACADLLLLAGLSAVAHLQDFALWGTRVTRHHVCLLPQVLSFTYGLLPGPVFLLAGLDHYLHVAATSKASPWCQHAFYFLSVLLLWAAVLAYVLGDPAVYGGPSPGGLPSPQCPLYVGAQSRWLSVLLLAALLLALGACGSEVLALVRHVRLTSLGKEPALYFPQAPDGPGPGGARKRLLARLLIAFLGTWLPFVGLQAAVLALRVRIPAYVEVNVPWLYFVNSFLVAVAYWCQRPAPKGAESACHADPFVSWEFCFAPPALDGPQPPGKAAAVIVC